MKKLKKMRKKKIFESNQYFSSYGVHSSNSSMIPAFNSSANPYTSFELKSSVKKIEKRSRNTPTCFSPNDSNGSFALLHSRNISIDEEAFSNLKIQARFKGIIQPDYSLYASRQNSISCSPHRINRRDRHGRKSITISPVVSRGFNIKSP